jgi:adenylylsulfate kinase-like enzyme
MGKTRRAQPCRERPNILVTGTPGTGKTTLAAALAAATSLRHVDVGTAIREQSLHSGWDEEFQCHVVDEDKARPGGAGRRERAAPDTPTPLAAGL